MATTGTDGNLWLGNKLLPHSNKPSKMGRLDFPVVRVIFTGHPMNQRYGFYGASRVGNPPTSANSENILNFKVT